MKRPASVGDVRRAIEWRLAAARRRAAAIPRQVVDAARWRLWRLAWKAYSGSLYRAAFLYRPLLRRTAFVGITGSAGKTTTKDLLGAILERHFHNGRKGQGTLNGPYDVAQLVLHTRPSDAYCVTEIAITNEAGIDLPLALFRPAVGVVTSVGGEHAAAYGGIDGVAGEKGKLVAALPSTGIAILNADDPRVLAMRSRFGGRIVTFGTADGAMLRGQVVDASWPSRLSLNVTWNGTSAIVRTRLCGAHWTPTVLAAVACGVALGVPLTVASTALESVEPYEGRMSPVELDDGVTFIRDDWKAPLWSVGHVFDFMREARASRKVIVIGTLSDYTGPYTPRYVRTAERALAVADCVLFVGPRASACLRAKRRDGASLHAFPSMQQAAEFLSRYLRSGDLVLLKGSIRTDHLERLILARIGHVACWRLACRRGYFCDRCDLLHVPSSAETASGTSASDAPPEPDTSSEQGDLKRRIIVIGLGNSGDRYEGTRHNVGQRCLDVLATRLGGEWVDEGGVASLLRSRFEEHAYVLVKLAASMNDCGPPLRSLANRLGFALDDCILVHDDLDLPLGRVRVRHRGGDGGHRGVQSIIQAFQDDKVRRVKMGIGKPQTGQSVADFVLSPFGSDERHAVDAASHLAADRVLEVVRESAASSGGSRIGQETPQTSDVRPS